MLGAQFELVVCVCHCFLLQQLRRCEQLTCLALGTADLTPQCLQLLFVSWHSCTEHCRNFFEKCEVRAPQSPKHFTKGRGCGRE